ncbi:MAG TPA: alanine--tRNA ligase-related protein, partial [Candidatus Nanoarchaeia archaeon]|nr:alanine--tRNA ligase-related protein [Candidatus Nanoarchaeia archaeon]
VERTIAVLNSLEDNYLSSIFQPIIKEIESISEKKYKEEKNKRSMRIIADHIRAATFILGDEMGVKPSNIGQGYVLRRLIRRAIRYGKILGINENFTSKLSKSIIPIYPDYPELKKNSKFIESQLNEEESKFNATLENGLIKFNNLALNAKEISGKEAFLLFQSFGFPIEMTLELAKEKSIKVNVEDYNLELAKHKELSRTTSSGVFKSGLADNSEQTKKLHTATHLLNEALKVILKDKNIKQRGSNINLERLRFDFSFPRKLTDEEIKKTEEWINKKIKSSLNVKREEMPVKEAFKLGAEGEFGVKYPDIVSVYTVEDKNEKRGYASKEICTGPHVNNTKEIGKFKIVKEESVSAGVRRIKAIVE